MSEVLPNHRQPRLLPFPAGGGDRPSSSPGLFQDLDRAARRPKAGRIVGGRRSGKGAWPWQVRKKK